jgi:hypothetical protein
MLFMGGGMVVLTAAAAAASRRLTLLADELDRAEQKLGCAVGLARR